MSSREGKIVLSHERLANFWAQTEGRDKLSKCLQYGCRFLSWFLSSNPDLSKRFAALWNITGDSRKIFRLGKSLNEYIKLKSIVASPDFDSPPQLALFASRLGFFGFWLYDNLAILSKIKFLSGDAKPRAKKAAFCWLCGLIFGIMYELYCLRNLLLRELKLRRQILHHHASSSSAAGGVVSSDDGSNQKDRYNDIVEAEKDLMAILAKKNSHCINIIKNCGDMITASNMLELPHKFSSSGKGFNDGIVGLGGFTSAALTCYQTFK